MGIEKNIEALERKKLSVLNEHKDGYWAATTYKILMLNQFAYGEIVELKSAMNSEQCYKFGLKRAMNNLDAEMTKYNKVVWGIMNGMEETFDDIENRITDAVKKDIDILYYSVLREVEKLGVRNVKSLTRCIMANLFIDSSNATNTASRAAFKELSGYDYDNLEYLRLDGISRRCIELESLLAENKFMNLNDKQNIVNAYKIFYNKINDNKLIFNNLNV